MSARGIRPRPIIRSPVPSPSKRTAGLRVATSFDWVLGGFQNFLVILGEISSENGLSLEIRSRVEECIRAKNNVHRKMKRIILNVIRLREKQRKGQETKEDSLIPESILLRPEFMLKVVHDKGK